jgi:2,3-bisphosphoglycerate-independent phosphoglycerate mutase
MKKILFVILDGAADKDRSAYRFSDKPNLDWIAKNGFAGLVNNELGGHPDSGISIWNLLGYSAEEYPGRGYLEALGAGLTPAKGDVCVRGNFAAVREEIKVEGGVQKRKLIVSDRRAGRDDTGLEELVSEINKEKELKYIDGVRFDLYKSVGHRVVIIMKNSVSPDISDADPGDSNLPVEEIKPTARTTEAAHTAAALNKWLYATYNFLKSHPINRRRGVPANFILTRGPGAYRYIKEMKIKYGLNGAVVTGSPVVKGIARALGMSVIEVVGATGKIDTNLEGKVAAALAALSTRDFVLLHVLAPDIAAHDKILDKKIKIIEKIDEKWFKYILNRVDFDETVVAVTSDHITDVWTGLHLPGHVPFAIYTKGIEKTGVKKFDEVSCKIGPLIEISDFFERLLEFR